MKGLLLKDLMILRNQKKTMLMILILGIAMALMMETMAIISYYVMLGCMLALGTIAYDEMENGFSFLFTLPVSRKTYVREKYIFMAGWVLICALAGVVLCGVLVAIGLGKLENGWADISDYLFPMLAMAFLIIAVTVPLRIKYGSEKSRIVLYIIIGIAVILGVAIVKLSGFGSFAASARSVFEPLDSAMITPIILAVSAILLLLSERLSQKYIAEKEY